MSDKNTNRIAAMPGYKPSQARNMGTWASDEIPIVVDSATSRTVTPRFEDLIDPEPFKCSIEGIGKGSITHVGKVKWLVTDDNGKEVIIEDDEAYLSKEAPYRLLCPHSWKKCQDDKRFEQGETQGDGANFYLSDDNDGYVLTWNRLMIYPCPGTMC